MPTAGRAGGSAGGDGGTRVGELQEQGTVTGHGLVKWPSDRFARPCSTADVRSQLGVLVSQPRFVGRSTGDVDS